MTTTSPHSSQHRILQLPLVSCVMVTCGRATFVAQSLKYYRRQSYSARELVIVYERNSDLPAALLTNSSRDPSIRLVQMHGQPSIGSKRNRGVSEARGVFIAQWDDDDWYGPERLSVQLAPLLCGSAEFTGLCDTVFFELDAWRFWATSPDLHARMFLENIAGGSLVFRRSTWNEETRYPDTSLREDADFLVAAMAQGARLVRLSGYGLFLYVRHGANTWRFTSGDFLSSDQWFRLDEPDYLASDRGFFQTRSQVNLDRSKRAMTLSIVAGTEQLTAEPHTPEQDIPHVACIMPTCDRETFVRRSVRYFQRQTYKNKELIIVDDGAHPVHRILPDDERIQYIRLPKQTPLGTKRNLACEATQADIIVHWDDDDWMAPTWIDTQVHTLLHSDADVCGLASLYFYDPVLHRAWRYTYPANARPWVAGATLCYTRRFWQQNPFPSITMGEDLRFLWDAADNLKLVAHDHLDQFVAYVHEYNTITRRFIGARWSQCPVERVERHLLHGGHRTG